MRRRVVRGCLLLCLVAGWVGWWDYAARGAAPACRFVIPRRFAFSYGLRPVEVELPALLNSGVCVPGSCMPCNTGVMSYDDPCSFIMTSGVIWASSRGKSLLRLFFGSS
jgi:hypothetical protein